MGIAEIIPGISGGTLALILGIYERLIFAINSLDLTFLNFLKEKKIMKAWRHIDGDFIFILFIGMLVSIFTLSSLILFIMKEYPVAFKSFLSAILFLSAFLEPLKPRISKAFFAGLAISFIVCSLLYLLPEREMINLSTLYVFFSGFVAITALVVPGISGSFILLLLGSYQSILTAVRDLDISILSAFIFGAFLGLLTIVRVIKLFYEKKKDLLMAIFFGLIVFCIPLIWTNQSGGEIQNFSLTAFLVGSFLGGALVYLIQKLRRH